MADLEIIFSHNFKAANSESTNGPQFHRYLPDKTDGSIEIPIERPAGILQMWFARKGSTSSGWVVQDYTGEPLELERIMRQAIIEGGHLWGSFLIRDADDRLVAELRLKKFGAPLGVAFGEQILRAVINKHVVRAVESIRHLLGQYWLRPLPPWDRDLCSAGSYCQYLQMQWRVSGEPAQTFCPVRPVQLLGRHQTDNPYLQLPNEARWLEVSSAIQGGYEPTIVSQPLVRAHELKERGDWRLAFVEATTALELAVDDTIKSVAGSSRVASELQSVHGLKLKPKLAMIGSFLSMPVGDIELCLRGVDIRNKAAHEGASAKEDADMVLSAMLSVGRTLSEGPKVAFPRLQRANEQRDSNSEWEETPGPRIRATLSISSTPPGFTDWQESDVP